MDSDQKQTAVVAVLFISFLLGMLYLGKILDPYTLHSVTFRSEERTVAVYTGRRVVSIGGLGVGSRVFEQGGEMMTRVTLAVPRRGFHVWIRTASAAEVELFHKFF